MWVGLRRFFGILGLTSNWQFMLSTIGGSVVASLLTKFMFLYDDETKLWGKYDLARIIRQHEKCDVGDDVPTAEVTPLMPPGGSRRLAKSATHFHALGSLYARRTREHI